MLTNEWHSRIKAWKDTLPKLFYSPLKQVQFDAFLTKQIIPIEEAQHGKYSPMPEGTQWGGKWEYGWFKTEITLPSEAIGKRIVFKPDLDAESAVYINGKNAGAIDWAHKGITLDFNGKENAKYEVMIEAYAGHGPRECGGGPIPHGKETVPEPPERQCTIKSSTVGIWNEDIYQLWLDIESLYQIRSNIDPDSLRVAEIDAALRKFTKTVDVEQELPTVIESAKKCREDLKPLLDCVNGSTSPTMYAFGHSHIDVVWLWPLEETIRKCSRTFSTQLALMEEYPEYKYLQSQAVLYEIVKKHYPDLFKRIKDSVKNNGFVVDGAMWVEPDTNIAGGEALVRQFVHGKKYFKDEFGVDSKMCWLPDVFGYSGQMPQIMKGCGVDYFATQKIFWTYNNGSKFPYNTFWWEGLDGSKVLSHIYDDYCSETSPHHLINKWKGRVQKEDMHSRLYPFGWGDGGGGPTRDHLEFLRRAKDLEGVPKTKITNPVNFFEDLKKTGIPEKKFVGELYFQEHRGTYTSQAKTKKGNRKGEFALREAEMWGVIANKFNKFKFDSNTLDSTWKKLLINQFHDILPGSSIAKVYERTEAEHKEILNETSATIKDATNLISDKRGDMTVFNSLSWDSKKLVELPHGIDNVRDEDGNTLTVQHENGKTYAETVVPSCGWTTLHKNENPNTTPFDNTILVSENLLENEYIRVSLNQNGEITSIFGKEQNRELSKGVCNRFEMFKDVTNNFDAWDLDSMYKDNPVKLQEGAKIEVASKGPLFSSIKVEKKLNNSLMTQEIILRKGSRRVDFKTTIDWNESHKLLKVAFPVDIHANEATQEIQYGHIKRPNHFSMPFDEARFEVCNHKWTALMEENRGVAILNDSKYGVNVFDNAINLTLLKSAMAPDMKADIGKQEFTYSIYSWNGPFVDCEIVKEGYELNTPVVTSPGGAGRASVFGVDKQNIIVDTVKPAEDNSGDVVVRMYESKHMATRCNLNTTLDITKVSETNMLENHHVNDLKIVNGRIGLEFRPFEIKTIRLHAREK